jgi:hypothetical protein
MAYKQWDLFLAVLEAEKSKMKALVDLMSTRFSSGS